MRLDDKTSRAGVKKDLGPREESRSLAKARVSLARFATRPATRGETVFTTSRERAKAKGSQVSRRENAEWSATTVEASTLLESTRVARVASQEERAKARATRKARNGTRVCNQFTAKRGVMMMMMMMTQIRHRCLSRNVAHAQKKKKKKTAT